MQLTLWVIRKRRLCGKDEKKRLQGEKVDDELQKTRREGLNLSAKR